MNRMLARLLLRAYPRVWRERYGDELEDLLHTCPGGPRTILDVLRSAFRSRWLPPPKATLIMSDYPGTLLSLSRRPSAFVPMAMSIAALVVVLSTLARFGVPPPHADEGAAAHIWQLLMVCQVPEIAWFAFRWLRKAPRLTCGVLAIQLALALAALAPVVVLGL